MNEEGITTQELLPIVLSCVVWGRHWVGRVVEVHCDNTRVVAVLNAGHSRVPRIMHLLRCLFFIRALLQGGSVGSLYSGAQSRCDLL